MSLKDKDIVTQNSEIMFIYEARLCNPNGDPDRENKPRIDPVTQRNYVTDVRLKRFLRDYIYDKFGEDYIWVTTIKGENVTADSRFRASQERWKYKNPLEMPKYHVDARLFGATLPIQEKNDKEGASYQFIGPVQYSMGYSLHKVDIITETSTITSRFTGAEKQRERQYGTIGKDWRVYYSLVAFYGVINAARARQTGLSNKDVMMMDNFLWEAVERESITRSKIGHFPHLYIRIQHKNGETLFGDLRRFIDDDFSNQNIRELKDVQISLDRLFTKIEKDKLAIDKILVRVSEQFENRFNVNERLKSAGVVLIQLPHPHDFDKDSLIAV